MSFTTVSRKTCLDPLQVDFNAVSTRIKMKIPADVVTAYRRIVPMAQLKPFDVSIDWDQHAAKCRLSVKKVGPDFHVDWTDEASVEANHKRLEAALGELAKADKEGSELLTKFAALARSVPKFESEVAALEKRLAGASTGHATIDRALLGSIAALRAEIARFRAAASHEMNAYQIWRNDLPRLVSTDVLPKHHNVNEQLLESAG